MTHCMLRKEIPVFGHGYVEGTKSEAVLFINGMSISGVKSEH